MEDNEKLEKLLKDSEDKIKEAKRTAAAEAEKAVEEYMAQIDAQPAWKKFMKNFYGYNTGCGRFVIAVLTILLVLLKLTNVISWSWLWVLSPLWVPVLLSLIFYFIAFVFFLIEEAKK